MYSQHNTTQHNTTQHNTTQHNTTQHNTTQKIINDIVWWIPIKKLRNNIRVLLNNLYQQIELYNEVKYLKQELYEIKNNLIKEKVINYKQNIYKYDFIFSIGSACQCATMLNNANIRKYSGVFDWSYGSSIYENLNIINSKFNNFFNKEDLILETITNLDNQKQFSYFNQRTSLHYMHDFSQDKNKFDREYIEINSKYQNRILRTINYLNNNNVLMVYMTGYKEQNSLIDIKKIINKIYNIRRTYNNNNIDLLFIRHYESKQNKIFFNSLENDMIHIYDLNNKPNKDDIPIWMCNIDDTLKILKQYKIKE